MKRICFFYVIVAVFGFSTPALSEDGWLERWYDILFMNDNPMHPPEIISPAFDSRFSRDDMIPVICVAEIPDAIRYEFEFSLVPEFSISESDNIISVSEAAFSFSDYIDSEEWHELSFELYFRVRAVLRQSLTTEWSSSGHFTKSSAAKPEIFSPGIDARFGCNDLPPIFAWQSLDSISQYCLEFARDPDFIDPLGTFITSRTIIDFTNTKDRIQWEGVIGTFYWRVSGIEQNEVTTPFSDVFYFSKTTIEKPNILTPEDQTFFDQAASLPEFSWNSVDHSSRYHVQFALKPHDFPDGLEYLVVSDTRFNLQDIGITQDMWNQFYGRLFWRVAAVDQYGNHGSFGLSKSFFKVQHNRYVAYGDSITGGYGSAAFGSGYSGYPPYLQDMLRDRYQSAIQVLCQENISWFPGGHAYTGDFMAENAMEYHAPVFVLIMFGTVDALDSGAPGCDDHDCHTIEHLENIIETVRTYQATPMLATLPPVNPASIHWQIQDRIDSINHDIRILAAEKNVQIADMEEAFYNAPLELPSYYYEGTDWAHFNDLGYELMARTWNDSL